MEALRQPLMVVCTTPSLAETLYSAPLLCIVSPCLSPAKLCCRRKRSLVSPPTPLPPEDRGEGRKTERPWSVSDRSWQTSGRSRSTSHQVLRPLASGCAGAALGRRRATRQRVAPQQHGRVHRQAQVANTSIPGSIGRRFASRFTAISVRRPQLGLAVRLPSAAIAPINSSGDRRKVMEVTDRTDQDHVDRQGADQHGRVGALHGGTVPKGQQGE